jgi:hypothetical protein
MRHDDGVVVVGRQRIGEAAVGCIEVEFHRVVVDLAGSTSRKHALECGKRVRAVGRVGDAVDRGNHVLGRHFAAVMEFHALADLEGPDRAVGIRRPAFGECGPGDEVLAGENQRFGGLAEHRYAARIAELDRLDGGCRHLHAQADGAALGLCARRCRKAAEAHGAGHAAEERQRHAQHRAEADELTAADAARNEPVNQVVFVFGTTLAQGVQQLEVDGHRSLSAWWLHYYV